MRDTILATVVLTAAACSVVATLFIGINNFAKIEYEGKVNLEKAKQECKK